MKTGDKVAPQPLAGMDCADDECHARWIPQTWGRCRMTKTHCFVVCSGSDMYLQRSDIERVA